MSLPVGLRDCICGARWVSERTVAHLPDGPGSYVLLIRLPRRLPLDMPRLGNPVLSRGWYAYCGSAHGPGGIRARVSRHMRREKTLRWHVDRLTIAAGEVRAAAFADRGECDLVATLMQAGFTVPVSGFGSTDCRVCPAHLLRWPGQGATVVGSAVT
ncbi:Uri superfamily endonuclease [Breoghania corrubedonensis]|uniref:Uri superfamily endonuclease n=1 Tax=Breoghania corrubedonensis TaxID=665038 RepID=A0A2T5V4S9_9HYPH|nr:GIY-YIG nuclease family protein [Breoghania corrubedonensis]PTW58762.1 Uri superfamily endonuclease [Breoghania corrubedonensis]